MPVSAISTFTEPDDYQAELSRDAEVDFLVTGRGAFRAGLTRIALPRLSLSASEERLARIAVISIAPQSIRIALPVSSGTGLVSNGVVVHPGEIVAHGSGARHQRQAFARSEDPADVVDTALSIGTPNRPQEACAGPGPDPAGAHEQAQAG